MGILGKRVSLKRTYTVTVSAPPTPPATTIHARRRGRHSRPASVGGYCELHRPSSYHCAITAGGLLNTNSNDTTHTYTSRYSRHSAITGDDDDGDDDDEGYSTMLTSRVPRVHEGVARDLVTRGDVTRIIPASVVCELPQASHLIQHHDIADSHISITRLGPVEGNDDSKTAPPLRKKKALSLKRKLSVSSLLTTSRMRASRSHESLLVTNNSMHTIDITAPDVQIKPLHSTILGQEHCFQVTTPSGSKYYSCRSAQERQQWIQALRKSVQPQQERTRRTENSCALWVLEAKNLLPKKRYFCEICLDQTVYAKTSTKTKSDMLFWGEHFDFTSLPTVDTIVINLYKEHDKKKKKDKHQLIGSIHLPVSEVCKRQPVERWYAATNMSPPPLGTTTHTAANSSNAAATNNATTATPASKSNKSDSVPQLRVKARFQSVDVLPMILYQPLVEYIERDYTALVAVLEPLIAVKAKEEIATCLVRILIKLGSVQSFLEDIVMAEVNKLDNENLTFRGNSIATKAMEAYIKIIGEKYLHTTLSEFITTVIESSVDCEVDPARVTNTTQLHKQQTQLQDHCELVWYKIINSAATFPPALRSVFHKLREQCKDRNDVSDNLISSCLFLRFLCPAILSPSLFSLLPTFPCERSSRNLTLIAKTVQNLANFTKFGAKEDYMNFMNSLVERELPNMKNFLQKISTTQNDGCIPEYDGYIDLGKELSILHTLLTESLQQASESATQKLTQLITIMDDVSTYLKDPALSQQKQEELDNLFCGQHADNSAAHKNVADANANPVVCSNGNVMPSDLCQQQATDMYNTTLPRSDSDNDYVMLDNTVTNSVVIEQKHNQQHLSRLTPGTLNRSHTLPLDERSVNQTWNSIVQEADKVSAGELVNGADFGSMLSYADDTSSYPSVGDADTYSQTSVSQISTIASSGYHSTTPYSINDSTSYGVNDTSQNSEMFYQNQPLSFANPVFQKENTASSANQQTVSAGRDKESSQSNSNSSRIPRSYSHDMVSSPGARAAAAGQRSLVNVSYSSSSNESLLSATDSTSARNSSPRVHRANRHHKRHGLCQSNHSSSVSLSTSSSVGGHTNFSGGVTTVRPALVSTSSVEYPGGSDWTISPSTENLTRSSELVSSHDKRTRSPLGIRRVIAPHDTRSSPSKPNNRSRINKASSNNSLNNSKSEPSGGTNATHVIAGIDATTVNAATATNTSTTDSATAKQILDYERELNALREKLAETQAMLSDAQQKIREQEEKSTAPKANDSHAAAKSRTDLAANVNRVQQQQQQDIDAQARRYGQLDAANHRLNNALHGIYESYHVTNGHSVPTRARLTLNMVESGQFKTSSC